MDIDLVNGMLLPRFIGAEALPATPRAAWVATCNSCHDLLADPLGRAHRQLQITGAKKEASGLSSGLIFRYRCTVCGFSWRRAAASTSDRHVWLGGAPAFHSPSAAGDAASSATA